MPGSSRSDGTSSSSLARASITDSGRSSSPSSPASSIRTSLSHDWNDISHGDGDCAGFWPASAGWHRLHIGDAEHPFLVPDGGQPVALRLSELRDASLRIAATPTIVQASAGAAPSRTAPGTPWPWFVAWLLLAAATWSLERSRMGLRVAAGT